ncbi:MAG: (d)CMP kinase [Bacillota bacterium]|nr:(d)CMP kinase [Bacillota bacterium]
MLQDKCYPKIAIDGPAGAGKSTVTREIARRLQIKYLDTGAMYRAITLKVIQENIDLNNSVALQEMLSKTDVQINGENRVFLDGEDVTSEIRSPQVNRMVSPVSCISSVRRKMVAIQQAIVMQSRGIIMEGRDIASRVMPDADFKFFLDASVEERARRRMKEQQDKGIFMSAEEVASEIAARDRIDSTREDSPLAIVPEAIVIDTTTMAFEEVVDEIIRIIREGLSCSGNG